MIRILTGILLSAVAAVAALSQSHPTTALAQQAGASQTAWLQDKAEVLRQINLREAEARSGEANHADPGRLAANYSSLAFLYMDAGMGLKAEDAFHRSIALLKDGPQDRLADQMEQLGVLQTGMGELRQAEKAELQALEIRRSLRDPVAIALTEELIAGVYDVERKFTRARHYAQEAYDALVGRADVSVPNRIKVWHALGFTLTGLHDCDRGIDVLKEALEMARNSAGWGDASVAYSEYALGFGYWHCSDQENAAVWLQRGTTDMKAEFGWSHATYVYAMKQYALFLRHFGRTDDAVSVEAVVRQAESVVDASTLTDRSEALRNPSP